MSYSCYLSGAITHLKMGKALTWRAHTAEKLLEAGITVLDPLRGSTFPSRKVVKPEEHDKVIYPMLQDRVLVRRDMSDVVRLADSMLCNLIDNEKVSIGTMFELAWAMQANIFVAIALGKLTKKNVHNHPFVRDAGPIFETLEEAEEAIISAKPQTP